MRVPKFCLHLSVECIGFVWQGSHSGTTTGVVSVRSCEMSNIASASWLLPGPITGQGRPIRDGGGISGIRQKLL